MSIQQEGFKMLTGISTKEEVLSFFIKHMDNYYQDADDELLAQLIIAKAEELIAEDVDFWANQSVRKLRESAEDVLSAGNPDFLNQSNFHQ
jgi:hypothetical protein